MISANSNLSYEVQGSIFYIKPPPGGDFVGKGEVCKLPTFTKKGGKACYNKKLGKMNIKNQYEAKKKLNKHEETIRGTYFTSQFIKFLP